MKLFRKAKDGGPKSTVTGYWLVEIKRLFSIVLLKFEDGSRDEYHNHAFNSLNWVLKGKVVEEVSDLHLDHRTLNWDRTITKHIFRPSIMPIKTLRNRMHRVVSDGTTWVFSIRGPWSKTWLEYDPKTDSYTTLTHGRKVVS